MSPAGTPFTLVGTPSAGTATFSYDFSGFPPGNWNFTVINNEGTSNGNDFQVLVQPTPPPPPPAPPVDPCAVVSSPQVGFTSLASTGTAGGNGTVAVSFNGAAFAGLTLAVGYGANSTPSSIAASIAALVTKRYYRSGLGARAFGSIVVYSGNANLGTVSNTITGSSFTADASSTEATRAQNACHTAPPASPSMYAVAYSGYIPVDHVTGPDICFYYPPNSFPLPAQLLYRGDAFRNTYRVTQAISLNLKALNASGYFADTGISERYGYGSPYVGLNTALSSQDDDSIYYDKRTNTGTADCYLRDSIGKADTNGWTISPTVTSTAATVTMSGTGQNPLSVPFGGIFWKMDTHINATSHTGFVTFDHTCYPSHQIKVANTSLYLYTPLNSDPDFIVACLTGFNEHVKGTTIEKDIR